MNSRAKGCRGEREAAAKIREYGYDARRGQQFSGANGDADVEGLPGVHIEVKRKERLNVYEAMKQSIRDAKDDDIPIVMHRKNGEDWLVILEFDRFMELYGEAKA